MAKRFKPSEEKKMELKLSRASVGMLNALFRQPILLFPFNGSGQPLVPPNFQPYTAADETGSLQVVSIQRWLEKKVCRNDDGEFEIRAWQGKVKASFISRFREVMKHYEQQGKSSNNIEAWLELSYQLEGKELDSNLESPEE
jgi:hypothetical protein